MEQWRMEKSRINTTSVSLGLRYWHILQQDVALKRQCELDKTLNDSVSSQKTPPAKETPTLWFFGVAYWKTEEGEHLLISLES